jgi:hypothetical protein
MAIACVSKAARCLHEHIIDRITIFSLIDSLRWRGSVIPTVISDVIIITVFTALVIGVDRSGLIPYRLNVPNMIGKSFKTCAATFQGKGRVDGRALLYYQGKKKTTL